MINGTWRVDAGSARFAAGAPPEPGAGPPKRLAAAEERGVK
jgi:hypothetical protein